jgi:glycogen debranching enzyme
VTVTVLEGSTFCVSDDRGDIDPSGLGLFAEDTRFLSRFELTVNGTPPLLLSAGRTEHNTVTFVLRNPVTGGLAADEVSIARTRVVVSGLQERIVVRNHAPRVVELDLRLAFGADFADIFAGKQREHDLRRGPGPIAPEARAVYDEREQRLELEPVNGYAGRTFVFLSRPGLVEGGEARFALRLGPRQEWAVDVVVRPAPDGAAVDAATALRLAREEAAAGQISLAAWREQAPHLTASRPDVQRTYERSVADLGALRLGGFEGSTGNLVAAGTPWFMTLFGRDSLIASYQALLIGPELARDALRALAALQATADDPGLDAEPGKILHEIRRGRGADAWFPVYYGTVDATPLWLVLLSEFWRWTGDSELVTELRGPALRALEWIDRHGDRDGDGFVEYEMRAERGLANQCWKDSGVSMVFHDGTLARGPIAVCEAQGYVYDAKRRTAELARAVWGDEALAARLEQEAAELARRFDEAFWCERPGGWTYALALDGDKRPVNSLTSNVGHLLWSGIVPEERVAAIASQLLGNELWSGWGVRTLGAGDAAYNPIVYHNGAVWPHDNSLVAQGLAQYGRHELTAEIARRLFQASRRFDYSLPELFAGFSRAESPVPVVYPTASRPQAWAAGTPLLLLRAVLGLEVDDGGLVANAPASEWLGTLRLEGVRALGTRWRIAVEGGAVSVESG